MNTPNRNIRGKYFAIAVLFVARSNFLASAQTPSPTEQQTSTRATAERHFKNIQVLKDIPANQLIPSMQFISASLGVECGFCHVENHFEQDDKKPKLIARKMIVMMGTINQNSFDGHREVTCNTCHHGERSPQGVPAIVEAPIVPKMPIPDDAALANLPNATEILKRYVTASGGKDALLKLSTREEKGTATFMGREIAIEIYDKASNKRASFMHLPNGDSATVFDGQQGWTGSPKQPPREMPPSELEGAKIDADLQLPLHLQQMFPELHPASPESIGGRQTYQLISESGGQPRIRLYFDQESGLLLRMLRYSDSPLGLNPVRVDYADYRPVDGVQVPYRRTVARPFGQFTIQTTDIQQNVPIDDARFSRPAGP